MATCAPMCAWRPAALCSHALGVQKEHALAVSCVPPHASLQPGNACVAFSRAEHAAARVPLARHAHAYPCLHTGAPVPWRGCARAPTSARLANGRVGNGGPRRFRPLQLPYMRAGPIRGAVEAWHRPTTLSSPVDDSARPFALTPLGILSTTLRRTASQPS